MEEYEMMPMEETGLIAFIMAYFLFIIVAYLFYGFCYGKIFEKAGKPLWAGFVPIYNLMVLLEIVGRPLWWIVLILLVPVVNLIVLVVLCMDLAKSFGKDSVYGILIVLFSFVMLPIMAFSNDVRYVGPAAGETGSV